MFVKIIPGARTLSTPMSQVFLTIGNFDGIHCGHRTLIEKTVAQAKSSGKESVVMTFVPHPIQVLRPDIAPGRLFSLHDQHHEIENLGVDFLCIEPFSREFSRLLPEQFLLDWVYKSFRPKKILVGYDFAFGEAKRGTTEFLRSQMHALGFELEVVPAVEVQNEIVSTSRIRKALKEGDVRLANKMLGRHFYVEGLVEKGHGRGHKIGYPTANLRTSAETIPAKGVYCAQAITALGAFAAMVNIGVNPTFTSNPAKLSIEAFLLDFNNDIYGQQIRISFIEKLRDEHKFTSVVELTEQIGKDVAQGRQIYEHWLKQNR